MDNWKHRSQGMLCRTCISFVPKVIEAVETRELAGGLTQTKVTPGSRLGRCRKHAPTMQRFPVVWETDWCGDHKLDEEKL